MNRPLIVINCKVYHEGTGGRADRIARSAQDVADESGVAMAIAPAFTDLHRISHHFNLPVFAQHLDGISPGAHTGYITAEAIRSAGAQGTLLNHSERRITLADLEAAIRAAKEHHLETIVCTNNDATSAAAAALGPGYVAVEPPELIGGKISVSEADPEIIRRSVAAVQRISAGVKVLAGAGIHSGNCVKIALDLGTDGVLLASSVVKAEDPAAVLRDLVSHL
ncbi:MAG: triose-phosphate isomerase [Methanomicrobiales archaeon]|nr:triose-phosphate isomerase [Methanomicrobiales archaeon]